MEFFKNLSHRQELGKIVRFGVTGIANTLVDYLVFALLHLFLGIGEGISQTASYIVGMLNSYLINRSWTFRSKERAVGPLLVRFVVANLVVLVVSVLLIRLLVGDYGMHALVAKLLVTAVTMVLNFIISRLWVFG